MRGRIPKPWFRKSTGTWYVWLDGKQVNLGKKKRQAHDEFNRLMATRGQGRIAGGRIAVGELIDLYLEDVGDSLSPETMRPRRVRLESFRRFVGGLQARDLKPFHVARWAKSNDWSENTVKAATATVKRLLSWAEDAGYVEVNPIRRLKVGQIDRRPAITLAEAEAVIARMPADGAVALRFLLLTGVRPGELCSLTVSGTDLEARQAIVVGKEGKRTVVLSEAAVSLLEPLVQGRAAGPVFRYGADRKPLTPGALSEMARAARGDLAHVKPHCFRGLFGTLAVKAGVDSLLVSELLGHSDPQMFKRHYAGDLTPEMRTAADLVGRIVRNQPDTRPDVPE